MLTYRTYLNTDPPHLLRIWAECTGRPGLVQPLNISSLERSVLNKPYFDPKGLILAFDDGRPVGFAHAGFAPSSDFGDALRREVGITCLLLVSQEYEKSQVPEELLFRCEEYLTSRGAQVLYGGSASPWHPFYLGLYGGFQLPGILESDTRLIETFTHHNYVLDARYRRFQLNLMQYRRPADPDLRLQFAQYSVCKRLDPQLTQWWDAVSYCESELLDYLLVNPATGRPVARVRFCKHNPNPHCWPAVGLVDIRVAEGWADCRVDDFLLGESLVRLQQDGISIVEAQCHSGATGTANLLTQHGFQPATGGVVFRKEKTS
ncbi:hypothetical protein [Thermogutta sp.]|uniref:hypothetical protein n=1 Tax=Thermogutta sp. TaxID=1962930 RepID=UPI003C7B5020